MSIRSRLFALPMPGFLRAACIQRLARLTSAAFGLDPRRIRRLDRYAAFTAEQAEAAMNAGTGTRDIEGRLFGRARELGSRLRFWLGVRKDDEAMAVARALYRVIGVDFEAGDSGRFAVSRCFFSSCYSASACRLISSLDAGLLCGLSGRREMVFTRRMTEGARLCEGVIR